MAEQKENQKKEMTDNQRALIMYSIVGEYNEKFRKNNPKKITLKQFKNNNLVELLDSIGKAGLMESISKLQNYKANPLSSYSKKMLEILKPHFSLDGIELDMPTKKAKLISPFEKWYATEFPNIKKTCTPNNTSVAEYLDFLFYKGIDTVPNLYKIGVINTTKTKITNLDSNAVKKFEELVSKIE